MKRLFILFLIAGTLTLALSQSFTPELTATIQAAGTTYYVAPSGSDNNPGTRERPFATLDYALKKVEAGDTINVRAGTYRFQKTLWIGVEGTSTARIVIQAYANEKPILDCAQTGGGKTCVSIGGQYIDFVGFEVRNARLNGIGVWGGSHVRIRNNVVHGSERCGIYVGYDDNSTVTDILIDGNRVYDNSQLNNPPPDGSGGGWAPSIGVFNATQVNVTNNLVYENYGEGITMGIMDKGVASGNVLHDNYSVNMYIDSATNITYKNNLIYTLNKSAFYRYDGPALGVQMANEDGARLVNHNQFVNNIVIGGRYNFYYGDQYGGGLRNTLVANNTFYRSGSAVIRIDADDGHQNTQFVNNIFYQTSGAPMIQFEADSGISFHHNNWYGGIAGAGRGTGDVTANPLLTNPGGTTAADYRLTANSPLINIGSTVSTLNNDYFGNTRPMGGKFDIGAHEYVSAVTPVAWIYLPVVQR